jgi:hypothetical protein
VLVIPAGKRDWQQPLKLGGSEAHDASDAQRNATCQMLLAKVSGRQWG